MAGTKYPDDLPDFKMGKSRQIGAIFSVEQPLQGMPYTVLKTEDEPPVIWQVSDMQKLVSILAF